jgi:uncharacterized protein YndB with AHSA1/START domain
LVAAEKEELQMIDVDGQINAVRRQLGSRVLEAGEARVATLSQSFDATVEDVWDACTNIERLPRWFLPVSGDLKLGGRYQIEGNAGGVIERCDPPKSFAATWEFGGGMSWIEVRLSAESAERTRFDLEHVALADEADEHFRQFGPSAVGIGWDMMIMGLGLHLSSGESVDMREATAWSMSPDGMRFARLSGEEWCAADIAAGQDEAIARERADNSIRFYTTPPEQP